MRTVVLMIFLAATQLAVAQIRWTGLAGSGTWDDAMNWETQAVPGPQDVVLLNNDWVAGSYQVILPDTAVVIQQLRMEPSGEASIQLQLPVSNTVASALASANPRAFTCTGAGYSISLSRNASFINASGSASGYSLRIADSLLIEDGARYVHRTRTGHADIVNRLSRRAGTDFGVYRMENTDASSTLSISNRVFGTLELSADGHGGSAVTYSSSGTSAVQIRGDLVLESNVNFSLHTSDTMHIAGSIQMQSAYFNLSNGNRSSCIKLLGNYYQEGGTVTESNATGATGTLLFAGSGARQYIHSSGFITDSVRLVVANPEGVELQHNLDAPNEVNLLLGNLYTGSYRLNLLEGGHFTTDAANGVDGTVAKQQLNGENFVVPFVKQGLPAAITLSDYKGDVLMRYNRADPSSYSAVLGSDLAEVSALEYWAIDASPAQPNQQVLVRLSYADGRSGTINDHQILSAAALQHNQWLNAGVGMEPGSTNESGYLLASFQPTANAGEQLFTLGTVQPGINVLPIRLQESWVVKTNDGWTMHWEVSGAADNAVFEVQHSTDGQHFLTVGTLPYLLGQNRYSYTFAASQQNAFCRLKIIEHDRPSYISAATKLPGRVADVTEPMSIRSAGRQLMITTATAGRFQLRVFDLTGRLLHLQQLNKQQGTLAIPSLGIASAAGIIFVQLISESGTVFTQKLYWTH